MPHFDTVFQKLFAAAVLAISAYTSIYPDALQTRHSAQHRTPRQVEQHIRIAAPVEHKCSETPVKSKPAHTPIILDQRGAVFM